MPPDYTGPPSTCRPSPMMQLDPERNSSRSQPAAPPTFTEALWEWARIGILSFGGPTAQIALMHRELVERRPWLDEAGFLRALSFCMLLPGPEAMQLATYAGWRLHGVAGGLAAGLLFVLPGAIAVLLLALVYSLFGNVPLIEAVFLGIKAAVVVIVIQALLSISKRALRSTAYWVLAGLSFAGIFFFALPFPVIIALAAAWGFFFADARAPAEAPAAASAAPPQISLSGTLTTVLTWLAIWWLPIAALAAIVGPDHILTGLALFFSKLAVVTFGGAYAVLAYMAETVVTRYGWVEAGQMLDGLGLAETTPGPLILVTEFIGYLAAFRQGGASPVLMGLAGAAVTLWVTFTPCFLWIFAGAPYIEWLNTRPRLRTALGAITAAVVGVILNLAIWFALHVFFAVVNQVHTGSLRVWLPDVATLDLRVTAIAILAAVLLIWRRWSIPPVLGLAGLAAVVLSLADP